MQTKSLILMGATLGLASIAAQAQSADQMAQALTQAQTAVAQAQAAAQQAQATLDQLRAEAASARQNAAAASPAAKSGAASGLTISNGPASATLYGLIDITLFNKSANGHTTTAPDVAWFSGNRWGINGGRDLGDDMKAIFRLESEFESETGNMDTPGVIFNRDAWLGLESSALGKLTFGRQNALARDPAASAVYGDPYGSAKASVDEGGYSNNNNFKQLIFYAGSANGTRVNNGVTWKKVFGNGFVGGLQYSFGGVADSFNTGSTQTGSLAYNGNGYTIAGFTTSANIANLRHQSSSIGGNIQINPMVRVNAGYYSYAAQQAAAMGDRKDTAWTLSTKLTPAGKMDYELGYQVMSASNAGMGGSGYIQNAFSDASGITAVGSGDRTTVYGSAFYHLDSATEIYLALDHLSTTNTYRASQAGGGNSADEIGIGMRFKF